MKAKTILICCISFLAVFTLLQFLPINGEEQIYDNMIRLHVLANSDSEEDQNLKLKVRDALLLAVQSIEAKDCGEAYIKTSESLEMLQSIAEAKIKEEGYDYKVEVKLGQEEYPEREYDGFTLPKGTYTSLRVMIGEARGQNWWCVLYPPLCTAAASKREEAFVAAGFTDDQYKAITDSANKKYKIRFKIVEIFRELFA